MQKDILFALFIMFAVLSACGRESHGVDEDELPRGFIQDMGGREIRIVASWPYLGSMPHEYIQHISHAYNVTISTPVIGHLDLLPRMSLGARSGRPLAETIWLSGDMMFPAITSDLIYALDEFVRVETFFQEPSAIVPNAQFVDLYWSFRPNHLLPLEGAFLGVNRDVLRAMGVEEDPLELWLLGEWDFEAFRAILNQTTGIGVDGVQYYGISGMPAEIIAHLIAANDGITVYNYAPGYGRPHTIAALEFAMQIFRNDRTWYYHHGVHDLRGNQRAFLQGRAAFFPISEWLLQHQSEIGFSYTIVPFPTGPDNDKGYTFVKGFSPGMVIPRGIPNPNEVLTVFDAIFQQADWNALRIEERVQVHNAFHSPFDAERALDIMRNQGKFDLGQAVPTYYWVNSGFADIFVNETMTVNQAVEQFHESQQAILDNALARWRIN